MATTRITVKSNGSLKLEGDFEIVDARGSAYDLGGREIISSHFEHDAVAFALPPRQAL